MKTKKYLFIIDPQNDFIEGGSLAVPGGKEALQRIVDSEILDRPDWDGIVVSLDSHNPSNLGFGGPKTELMRYLYGAAKVTQWPPHCLVDTHGWEIYEPLQKKLMELGNRKPHKVYLITKGEEDWKDAYSILSGKDGYNTIKEITVETSEEGDRIEFYWTGLAEDYCVYESIKDVIGICDFKIWHTLYSDMTACIKNHITEDENISITPYRP